jgi:hypothetical protein
MQPHSVKGGIKTLITCTYTRQLQLGYYWRVSGVTCGVTHQSQHHGVTGLDGVGVYVAGSVRCFDAAGVS